MTSKIQGIEGTKKKIVLFFIIIGAILGSIAPFVHIVFPRVSNEVRALNINFDNGLVSKSVYTEQKQLLDAKYEVFGFSNMRRFLFAIGMPIAILFCSLLFFAISQFILDKTAILGTLAAASIFLFTSLYFILWTIWPYDSGKNDFSENVYYVVMILVSISTTITCFLFFMSKSNYDLKIKELIRLVVSTRKNLFNTLEKHESNRIVKEEKSKFDNDMYETFDKVSK